MASCEPDSFHHRRPRDSLALSSLKNLSMIPTKPKGGFTFQISANLHQYPSATTAFSIINPHESVSYLELLKGSDPVSSRPFGSSYTDYLSSFSIFSTPLSDGGKDTHHNLQQPVHMPTFSSTQLSYDLKKDPHCEGGPNSPSPSISNTRNYCNPALTPEQSASNRGSLSGYQSTGYEHLGYPETTDNPFHSTNSAPQSELQRNYSSGLRAPSSSQLPQQYRQDGRVLSSDLYGEQFEQPIKIDSVQEMPTGSWMYPLAPQMHYVDSRSHGGSSASINVSPHDQSVHLNVNVHAPSTQPPTTLAPGVPVHLTLNGHNASSPAENQNVVNSNTRSHSPGHGSASYTYQTPSPSVLHNGNSNIYAGGEVSTSSAQSGFHGTDATSESSRPHGQHETPSHFSAPRGALCPPASSIPLEHYTSSYVERPHHDVQLLHCSQCTQRFASQDHFIKHQIKHQKLHRCRIPGCSRVEGFTTPNDRDRHEKSVHKTPGMYFRCMDESCASYMKTFARRDNLKDHLKRMHKMPPEMDDAEANERRNELADTWRVDLNSGLTPPPGV